MQQHDAATNAGLQASGHLAHADLAVDRALVQPEEKEAVPHTGHPPCSCVLVVPDVKGINTMWQTPTTYVQY
jgi:hypothetical protein